VRWLYQQATLSAESPSLLLDLGITATRKQAWMEDGYGLFNLGF